MPNYKFSSPCQISRSLSLLVKLWIWSYVPDPDPLVKWENKKLHVTDRVLLDDVARCRKEAVWCRSGQQVGDKANNQWEIFQVVFIWQAPHESHMSNKKPVCYWTIIWSYVYVVRLMWSLSNEMGVARGFRWILKPYSVLVCWQLIAKLKVLSHSPAEQSFDLGWYICKMLYKRYIVFWISHSNLLGNIAGSLQHV